MKYNYTSTLRTGSGFMDSLLEENKKHDDAFDEILLFNQGVHSVQSLDFHRKRAEVLSPEIKKAQAAGYRAGVNVLCTVGHMSEGNDTSLNLKTYCDIKGNTVNGRLCPSAPENLEFIREMYSIYAAISPDMIYVDDDLDSLMCACDDCVKEFAKHHSDCFANGELTRAALYDAMYGDDLALRLKSRSEWMKYNAERIGKIYENVAQAVNKINPHIILGAMTHKAGANGIGTDMWAEKLLGSAKEISWRPGGGVYNDYNIFDVIDKANKISAQICYLPEFATRVEAEIENFPYYALDKSPSFTAFESLIYLAAGCTGTAFNMFYGYNGKVQEEAKAYIRMAQNVKEYARLLTDTFNRKPLCGAGFWWDKNTAAFPTEKEWRTGKSVPSASEMHRIGIPYGCEHNAMCVYFINEDIAMQIPDDELLKCLSKGVLMDIAALKIINERGFSTYTGFKLIPVDVKDTREKELSHPLNMPGFMSRSVRQSFGYADGCNYAIEKTDDRAEYISEFYDLYGNNCGYSAGIFENSLGGRVCVEGITPFSWFGSLYRTVHIKNVIRYLSNDTIPAYISSYHRAAIWAREDSAFVANLATEEAEELRVMIKTESDIAEVFISKGSRMVKSEKIKAVFTDGAYKCFGLPEIPVLGTALIKHKIT